MKDKHFHMLYIGKFCSFILHTFFRLRWVKFLQKHVVASVSVHSPRMRSNRTLLFILMLHSRIAQEQILHVFILDHCEEMMQSVLFVRMFCPSFYFSSS